MTAKVKIALLLLTAGSVCMADYVSQISEDNPLHWYRFGNSSTTAANSGSGSVTGTAQGDANLNSGTAPLPAAWSGFDSANKGLSLDGTGDRVLFGNDMITSLNGLSAVTVEAWVNLKAADNQDVFQVQFTGGSGIEVEIEGSGIRLGARSTSTDGFQSIFKSYTDGAFSAGTWHQVVGVYDFGNSTIQLFVDGAAVGGPVSRSFNSSTIDWATSTITGAAIGGTGHPTSPDKFTTGFIDEVSIYGRVLSAQDIEDHYTAAVPEPATIGLFGTVGFALLAIRRFFIV